MVLLRAILHDQIKIVEKMLLKRLGLIRIILIRINQMFTYREYKLEEFLL